MTGTLNHYQTLGISERASDAEIKKAYRKLAVQYHPDKNPGNAGTEEIFKLIARAYEVLSNPEKKKAYDIKLGPIATEPTDFPGVDEAINNIFYGRFPKDTVFSRRRVNVNGQIIDVMVSEPNIYPRSDLEEAVSEKFDAYDGRRVEIISFMENITLELSGSKHITFAGRGKKPEDKGAYVQSDIFEGTIFLPRDVDLEVNIKSDRSYLQGFLAHRGRIETYGTNVGLTLVGDIGVQIVANNCHPNVFGMTQQSGLFVSQKNPRPKRKVELLVSTGSANISYVL